MNSKYTVISRTGDVYKGLKKIEGADAQFASRILLNDDDENAIFYPSSLKGSKIFIPDNIKKIDEGVKEIKIDEHTFTLNNDNKYIAIDNYNGTVLDLKSFTIKDNSEIFYEELSPQEIARKIMGDEYLYYTKSTQCRYKFKPSNLRRFTPDNIDESTFVIDGIKFIPWNKDETGCLLISSNHLIYDLKTLDYRDDIKFDKSSNQRFARDIKGVNDGEFYPKSTKAKKLFAPNNLSIIKNNTITVDGITLYRCKRHSNLFVSYKFDVFNIDLFEFINFDVKKEYTIQELGQIIMNTSNIVFPSSTKVSHILNPKNLNELEDCDKKITINKLDFYRIPKKENTFVSYNFNVFNFDTFTIKENKSIINDLTKQEFAQLIKETYEIVYPKSTNDKVIFHKDNLDFVNDTEMRIDSVIYYKTKDPYILKSADDMEFNLHTFTAKELEQPEFKETVQEICQRITGDYKNIFVPRSLRPKNIIRPTNIVPVQDINTIDGVIFKRHPYFKYIIGTKNLRIFNLETFTYEDKPSLELRLPFIKGDYYIIDDKKEFVYNKETNTINNQEIDWSNLLSVTPISKLRYFHPEYPEYFCNFYGRLYKIDLDIDTNKETIKDVTPIESGSIYVNKDGKTQKIDYKVFIYECYHNKLISDGKTVEMVKYYMKIDKEFYYCKWNLREINCGNEVAKGTILRHPVYTNYGWDTKEDRPYSFYGIGRYISKNNAYITVSRDQQSHKIPKNRFRYECIHQKDIGNDFMIGKDKRIKFRTEEFIKNGERFHITRNPSFYISDSNKVFYIVYEKLVPVEDDTVILSRSYNDKNYLLHDLIDIKKE